MKVYVAGMPIRTKFGKESNMTIADLVKFMNEFVGPPTRKEFEIDKHWEALYH